MQKINEGLTQAFIEDANRIVFWYDPEKTFESHLGDLKIADINIINMRDQSSLDIKIKIENVKPSEKFLLYFPSEEPEPTEDWLLDIKLYSKCFRADRLSMIFDDLKLANQNMRHHLVLRERFFENKQHVSSLKKWIKASANEEEIDTAMLAVLSNAEQPNMSHIIFALAQEMVSDDVGLNVSTKTLELLSQFGLDDFLMGKLQSEYGHIASEKEIRHETPFILGNFLISLLLTGFTESVGETYDWVKPHLFKGNKALAISRALLSHWRDSAKYYQSFDTVSKWVSDVVNIEKRISSIQLDLLFEDETFEQVERYIIVEIESAISGSDIKQLNHYSQIINTRNDSYWASRHHDDETRKKYRLIYQALSAAIEIYKLRKKYEDGFHFQTFEEFYQAYTNEVYLFDFNYRKFSEASQLANVEILKTIDDEVERCYSEWYLDHLAVNFGNINRTESFIDKWTLNDVPNQYLFFKEYVQPILNDKKHKRVAVIISDAFRYEAAVELCERINDKRYNEASLNSQLGVLPSYTGLGMAALLPHDSLEYKKKDADDIYVDNMSTKGTAARNKILSKYSGIAITSEEVSRWSRDEGREELADTNLIYIYHNVIDARGDSASTESETFLAVEQAIKEIADLVKKITSNLNVSRVVITADHGFIYQRSKLGSADKSSLEEKPENAYKSKKRYVIGNDMPEPKDAWSGFTRITAGSQCDTQFWIPKGNNRFHFVGGAKFVHGGAMPQEVVVPVILVKGLRGQKARERTKTKVGVISAKSTLKMVSNIQKFDFIQTDSVSEQVLPITISIGIYDEHDLVSSEEKITFNSNSKNISERRKSVRLSLSGQSYDRKKDYFMILKDVDFNNIEVERYKVTIDLAFTDDFSD